MKKFYCNIGKNVVKYIVNYYAGENALNIKDAKTIIIKVGSSTLTYPTGMLNLRKIELLIKCISDLQNSGKRCVLVSSGAIPAGCGKLGVDISGMSTAQKQAAAAVGQCELIDMYNRLFSEYGHTVAQILLTRDVVDDKNRLAHARATFTSLLAMGCIPVVNENDTVSSDEINFGGNDTLSATIALLVEADLLINMSDVDGLYDSDPRRNEKAKLITHITKIDEKLLSCAGEKGTQRGTGGMRAKLKAMQICESSGISMVIVNGADPRILYGICEDDFVGTRFIPDKKENGK